MDFALPVVRELVPLSPLSVTPRLAKQRERQARQALVLRSEQELYCRFEKRHGNLECAFSALGRGSADRPLLGETIRNWLAGGQEADFLWCESLAEGFALTLVMGGHVAKDGIYAAAHAIQELKLALSQLLRSGRAAKVYPGDPVAKQRVEAGLESLRIGLAHYVAKHMRDRHGEHWRHYASRAHRDESSGELDVYALLKTLLDQWSDLFRHDARLRRARSFISLAQSNPIRKPDYHSSQA